MTKLSIITINLNNLEGLQKTMQSVFAQTYTDFEYIVIDGGSTDGSKELIENQANKLVYWISEKDKGIYNAMNKGIVKATGEYILFMNSGDFLYASDTIKEAFKKSNYEDIIYGDAMSDEGKGDENYVWICPSNLTFKYFMTRTIHHTSALIKRELFTKWGLYNEDLKIMSDWEFFIKTVCLYQVSYKHVNQIISCFNNEGISSQSEYVPLKLEERQVVYSRFFKAFFSDFKETIEGKQAAEARLRLYQNSRMHNGVEKVLNLRFYKYLKGLLNL